MDEFVQYLQSVDVGVAYTLLALAAFAEYIAPPLPGDAVALAGIVLAATAGWSPLFVHLSLTAGSLVGGHAAWAFGRGLARREGRWPGWMKGARATRLLARTRQAFERHGSVILAANRFLPAMRAFFFVGAGLSAVPLRAVYLWGGLSAALWNAALLALGYALGSAAALEDAYATYAIAALTLVLVAALAWWVRGRLKV